MTKKEIFDNVVTHTLPNGLKLVHVASQSPVAWCGIVAGAGSRDDAPGRQGLAHFVEHTIFKGTTHRKAWHILNRMEAVGGELNAYTTKEDTTLYAVFPDVHYGRAVQLIADLVGCSVFPEAELDRERGVVLEEIDSYRDSPSDAIYDDFEDMAFAGSGLGHNILGAEADLNRITSADCSSYVKRLYVPANMVFFSMGRMTPDKAFDVAARHFGHFDHVLDRPCRPEPPSVAPQRRTVDVGSHQTHTVIGARLPGMHDDRRFALSLLNNIVGGPGMNSLLNVQLRERRGYVYTVESGISSFTDSGLFDVYFGCDESHASRSLRLVERTLLQLASEPMSARRLDAAKKQYCGQLLVASDNPETSVVNAGKSLLYRGRVGTYAETVERITAVTPQQLMDAAALIAPDRCSVLTFS